MSALIALDLAPGFFGSSDNLPAAVALVIGLGAFFWLVAHNRRR